MPVGIAAVELDARRIQLPTMPKCISRIALLLLLLLGAIVVSRCSADEDDEYEDQPPTQFGERVYRLFVAFVNGYITGVQDILDTAISPFMYVVEKFTEQLDQ